MEALYESDDFTDKHGEFKGYFEREFILNNKILHLPAPEIEIKMLKDNKISIKLKVWCQNKYVDKVKIALDKSVKKLSEKYKINFHTKDIENS